MLVSVKLKNPSDFQVFAKIENYNEIFASPYIVESKGNFLNKMSSVPANGESGFIFAIDITPFTKINPLLLSSPDEVSNIRFYNEKGEYIETAQANIANTYGMTIPYKVGIYNSNKELINTSNFEVLCRAKISELKATLTKEIDRIDLSKALNFECIPVY